MSSTLVECVPNFSEGRDPAKVDAIVEAMKIPGVYLLDREMDSDHNRCVITLVGEREAIQEAVLRGVGKAAELIDLTQHRGAHPRMGATDVIPFIPIDGVTIEDCVAMARHVGAQRSGSAYQIPVYLYESAATTPERQNLENIRRGQFEGIRAEIATNPARKPDFGDPRVHPTAGATVVGARKFLIAFNVFLGTADVEIAKKIAKAVRFERRVAFRKGRGIPGARRGAGVHEPHRFRADAHPSGVRDGKARSGALRRGSGEQRNRRIDPEESSGGGGGVVSAGREL